MKFCGFIWSPALSFFKEILENININNKIELVYEYNFNDTNIFNKSILDIYSTDDINIDKVKNIKIKSMNKYSDKFIFFIFEIIEPNFRKKNNGEDISQNVEKIKKNIRETYSKKIKDYIMDIIIHVTDNQKQYNDVLNIMKKYEKYKINTFIYLEYLLKKQIQKNLFNRADILVRKYSIEQFLLNNNYDFSLYKKMQEKRSSAKNSEQFTKDFKNLIHSFKKGYNNNNPINVNKNYELLNGSHRIACCIINKINFVPISIIDRNCAPDYSIEWFIKNKFNEQEIKIIQSELNIIKKYN